MYKIKLQIQNRLIGVVYNYYKQATMAFQSASQTAINTLTPVACANVFNSKEQQKNNSKMPIIALESIEVPFKQKSNIHLLVSSS